MRFLCISCDTKMNLMKTDAPRVPDKRGSLSLRYECPDCLMAVAMLTNPFETQLVTSLGVEIGGETIPQEKSATTDATAKCPFSEKAREALGQESLAKKGEMMWTAQALVRLQNIPEFVRAYAKKGIEKYALDLGHERVNEKCLDEAKDHFNM